MAKLLTTFDPTNPTSGNFVATFNTGCGTLHVKNASPIDVGFSLDSANYVQYVVQAGEPRDIPVPRNRSTVYWSQQQKLNTNTKQIQSVVYVESYEKGEVIPTSQALPRHNNQTAIGFSAPFNVGNSDGTHPLLYNVFNPATSAMNLTVYLILMSVTAAANLIFSFNQGADNALGTPVTPINHLFNGPNSIASVSVSTGKAAPTATTFRQIFNVPANTPQSFIVPYPDQIVIPPGFNVFVAWTPAVGNQMNTDFNWTETPA